MGIMWFKKERRDPNIGFPLDRMKSCVVASTPSRDSAGHARKRLSHHAKVSQDKHSY